MKWILALVTLCIAVLLVVVVVSLLHKINAPQKSDSVQRVDESDVVDARSANYRVVDVKTALNPGDATAAQQTLRGKSWQLISLAGEGGAVALSKPEAFVLTLNPDGTFSATTDCNGQFGTYRASETEFLVGDIGSTMMYCEGSQEQLFSTALAAVTVYEVTSRGELRLFDVASTTEMVFQ